ncbi:hypothetical protein D3C86_1556400 [compost metagenome]
MKGSGCAVEHQQPIGGNVCRYRRRVACDDRLDAGTLFAVSAGCGQEVGKEHLELGVEVGLGLLY